MKKCLTTFFSIAICLFVLPASIFADELLFSDKQRNEIKAAVELWLDGKYKVVSVSGTPVKNLLEVRIGNELVYVDSEGTHVLLEGQLIRLSDGKNLTELKKNKILNLTDVYNAKNQIVTFSDKMKKFDNQIKSFLKKKMYFHRKVHSKTNLGRNIIKKLFVKIRKNPKKFITNIRNNSDLERTICDYIAGMTDRYAINLYNKIQ